MGFSTIAGYIIFFFAIIIVVSSILMVYSHMVESSSLTYKIESERLQNFAGTSIEISPVLFLSLPGTDSLKVNLTNTGRSVLSTEHLDFYVDGIRIPRSDNNRTISFLQGNTEVNPLLWDPYEVLEIEIFIDLSEGQHIIEVTTEHGVKSVRTFSI
ncbi:MAG: hypothetical protein QXK37_00925 [Candidatus Woesearchaeota archaeon]